MLKKGTADERITPSEILSDPANTACLAKNAGGENFAEVKLFQVKPDKTAEFEEWARKAAAEQAAWNGSLSVKYMKRFYTIDGVELGDPPRELTKVVKCVKYYSYWAFDCKEHYGEAVKRFFNDYEKDLRRLLIAPFDINCGETVAAR